MRWPVVAWTALVLTGVGAVILAKELGRRDRAAWQSHHSAKQRKNDLAAPFWKKISSLYDLHGVLAGDDAWTRRDVETIRGVAQAPPSARGEGLATRHPRPYTFARPSGG